MCPSAPLPRRNGQAEWKRIGLTEPVHLYHYVKAGRSYFRPAERQKDDASNAATEPADSQQEGGVSAPSDGAPAPVQPFRRQGSRLVSAVRRAHADARSSAVTPHGLPPPPPAAPGPAQPLRRQGSRLVSAVRRAHTDARSSAVTPHGLPEPVRV